ncbi:Hypothetical_protein [Hexamita inflata]|uniref:Hypothetical_protein n=1 Tax=Hexamita inflata TaxID=28002 RepID=A0AA86QWU0_9EUKA|nr:Hypothetical protein HINF_LOCUS46555 [Hexamita inflata]
MQPTALQKLVAARLGIEFYEVVPMPFNEFMKQYKDFYVAHVYYSVYCTMQNQMYDEFQVEIQQICQNGATTDETKNNPELNNYKKLGVFQPNTYEQFYEYLKAEYRQVDAILSSLENYKYQLHDERDRVNLLKQREDNVSSETFYLHKHKIELAAEKKDGQQRLIDQIKQKQDKADQLRKKYQQEAAIKAQEKTERLKEIKRKTELQVEQIIMQLEKEKREKRVSNIFEQKKQINYINPVTMRRYNENTDLKKSIIKQRINSAITQKHKKEEFEDYFDLRDIQLKKEEQHLLQKKLQQLEDIHKKHLQFEEKQKRIQSAKEIQQKQMFQRLEVLTQEKESFPSIKNYVPPISTKPNKLKDLTYVSVKENTTQKILEKKAEKVQQKQNELKYTKAQLQELDRLKEQLQGLAQGSSFYNRVNNRIQQIEHGLDIFVTTFQE